MLGQPHFYQFVFLNTMSIAVLLILFVLLGGLMYVREWNNLQYVSAAAFLLAIYSGYLSSANAKLTCPEGQIQPQELLNFAQSQVIEELPCQLLFIVDHNVTNYC